MPPAYRRRILIEPAPARVSAELEDDYHRMTVVLHHAGGVVGRIDSAMHRAPWTLCPGAMRALEATFAGLPLDGFARAGAKTRNCTHLHDLALFAAAHAGDATPTAYDVAVTDPVGGVSRATLARNGAPLLEWTLERGRIAAPPALAGLKLGDIGEWLAAQAPAEREAGRILRWAAILAQGRAMDIPAGLSATAFPAGTCFNFQPETAAASTRLAGADRDLSRPGAAPLAEREAAFAPGAGL